MSLSNNKEWNGLVKCIPRREIAANIGFKISISTKLLSIIVIPLTM